MPPIPTSYDLFRLLRANPSILSAHFDNPSNPKELHVLVDHYAQNEKLTIPLILMALPVKKHLSTPFRALIAPARPSDSPNEHQACQDEPIKLGTQIQPANGNWYGTAGAPVRWIDPHSETFYGILSNWHVMAMGDPSFGRTQHQPTTAYSSMAALQAFTPITPEQPNTTDAALADALVEGYHTISREILGIGLINSKTINAYIGLEVQKSGRTTSVTTGSCVATGAAVRVEYPDFEALFQDQDIFEGHNELFSDAGDSGSLILSLTQRQPCALLFAGSQAQTVGNPIRYIVSKLNTFFDLT